MIDKAISYERHLEMVGCWFIVNYVRNESVRTQPCVRNEFLRRRCVRAVADGNTRGMIISSLPPSYPLRGFFNHINILEKEWMSFL